MQPALAPTVFLLGVHGTGALTLAKALQGRLATSGITVLAWEDVGGGEADLGLALHAASAAELTLLMGLDVPLPAERRPTLETADARLRAALGAAGKSYRVVYGSADTRIANALRALLTIKTIAGGAEKSGAAGLFGLEISRREERPARLRAWNCEKCSDPECEHRLFTALVGGKEGARDPA